MSSTYSVSPVEEWPLPLDQENVDDLVEDHPYIREEERLSVDEFHEKYVDELARNQEWVAFQSTLLSGVYVMNHAIGGGFRIPEEESFWMLADALTSLYEEGDDDE